MKTKSRKIVTISDALCEAIEHLAFHGLEDPEMEARALMAGLLEAAPLDVHLRLSEKMPANWGPLYDGMIHRRAKFEPVAYILGRKHFMDLEFEVDSRVLIPRPETELLVEDAIKTIKSAGNKAPRILEVGVGSGCVSIALAKKFPHSEIYAVDKSPEAIEVASANIKRHHVGRNMTILQSDLYTELPHEKRGYFDMIISNPPYISTSVLATLQPDLSYEPRLALDGGDDGQDLIRILVNEAPRYLRAGGTLLLEIGHDQGQRVGEMVAEKGFFDVSVQQDYGRHDRIVKGKYIGSI